MVSVMFVLTVLVMGLTTPSVVGQVAVMPSLAGFELRNVDR